MFKPIKSIANMTNSLAIVVFGDKDLKKGHCHFILMPPGQLYVLSMNDIKAYRGELHVYRCVLADECNVPDAEGKVTVREEMLVGNGSGIIVE